jgi:hypothetical protein
MKLTITTLVVITVAGAVVLASSRSAAPASDRSAPRQLAMYGHVKSLTRKGSRFELRLDPAFWLQGLTAERAAVAAKAIPAGEPVPNDYYILDEGHRVLTYLVAPTARVTVLTRGVASTRVTVAELAQIVRGTNPRHRPLLEPKAGFWLRVESDTVRSLDQQYQP